MSALSDNEIQREMGITSYLHRLVCDLSSSPLLSLDIVFKCRTLSHILLSFNETQ